MKTLARFYFWWHNTNKEIEIITKQSYEVISNSLVVLISKEYLSLDSI